MKKAKSGMSLKKIEQQLEMLGKAIQKAFSSATSGKAVKAVKAVKKTAKRSRKKAAK